jgi:hypothetical protein
MTVQLYKDWLHWAGCAAMAWLQRLDSLERHLRTAALIYHKIPYQLRHSSTMRDGNKIYPALLKRLSDILEADRPHSQQAYFMPWFEVYDAVALVPENLECHRPTATNDIDIFRTLERELEQSFDKLYKPYRNAKVALKWLVETVEDIAVRAEFDGSEALPSPYSREGSLFRQWISTLREVDRRYVESKSGYIEWYAQTLLTDGVEKDSYWSMLVDPRGPRVSTPAS